MEIDINKTSLEEIGELRVLFLQENNFQFIYDKCHTYHWADDYLMKSGDTKIGYASVWGKDKREERDAIFEFYLIPTFRKFAHLIFAQLVSVCKAAYIECQSNDELLTSMLFLFSQNIFADRILFEDKFQTSCEIPGAVFRKQKKEDSVAEDAGEYVLEQNGVIVATGGFVKNYNLPYIDMFYDVKEDFRKRGFGSLMVQELKKEAYKMARVPAARCNITNHASKATLLKGGMQVCGYILIGEIKELPNEIVAVQMSDTTKES
jgi:RimJ/RimL family protein N-acetyltransferase